MIAKTLSTSPSPYQLFKSYFKTKVIKEIYNSRFESSQTKGIDRLSGIQFKKQAKMQIKIIRNKCLAGDYKFSPYLELLHSKGRGEPPRVLAIPTIRDRIVLYALKEVLSQIFPECVPRKLANTHIHQIKKFIKDKSPSEFGIYKADIKKFYDSIDRQKLFKKLQHKIKSHKLMTLIKNAIETPIVPNNYHKKDICKYYNKFQETGIPQGLSISNILASIYLYDLDCDLRNNGLIDVYHRYVDDILIFTDREKINEIEKIVQEKIQALKLEINDKKSGKKIGNEEFEYLGYRFSLPKVTIRQSTLEKFINSIVAKFSSYIHNKHKRLKKLKENKYCLESLKEIFVAELNEKITGAISENKRYGWIFYFNAINDYSLLYQIDKIIAGLFERLEDFGRTSPPNLKKISRAFYEAKYNPTGGYIHNYNTYKTVEEKRDFLRKRGKLIPSKGYSEKEINDEYERCKQKNLSYLEKDDAFLY